MKTHRGIRLAAFALLWLSGSAAHAQPLCGTWNAFALPEPQGNRLVWISASSASDAWAVGTAVYHWDGSSWSLVSAPGIGHPDPLGYADTTLTGVAAVAPGDAWIVGFSAFLGTPQTLAERWNGSGWSVVPSPVIAGGSSFNAVTAIGANDAWAVGLRAGGHPEFDATSVTLTAHWNGASWSAVPSPNRSNRSHALTDVEAVAANDVWAVGYSRDIGGLYQTLILHWNGTGWSIVPSPNLPGENSLNGVSANSANDVWAVGDAWDGFTARQIFLHWNGSVWSQVNGPGGPTTCAGCVGDVLAMGADDVWAVGSAIGHWNGSDWTIAPGPEVPGSIGSALRSLAKVGDCDAWLAGSSFDAEGGEHALSARLTAAGGILAVDPRGAPLALGLRVTPNPARESSVIELALARGERVRVAIHDLGGREVRELFAAPLPAGDHALAWDGRDAAGRSVRAGVYFVTVTAGDRRASARVLRLN